jgi:hypothetical protein
MGGGDREHRPLVVIDLVEEPPGADPIPPGLGGGVLQLADVRAEMGMSLELWIDDRTQLANSLLVAGACDPLQIAGEGVGLKGTVLMQRNAIFVCAPGETRPATAG